MLTGLVLLSVFFSELFAVFYSNEYISTGFNGMYLNHPTACALCRRKFPQPRLRHYGRSGGQPVNNLSDMVRQELAMAGFTECMNWSLLSQKDAFEKRTKEYPKGLGALKQG